MRRELLAASEPGSDDSLLSSRQRLALQLADVYLLDPAAMGDDLRTKLLDEFKAAEIVEILLRVAHWSSNKISVSLGLDLDEISFQTY